MNHGKNVSFNFFQVRCAHKSGDVVNVTTVVCRISSRLKWYKNYKNRLRLAKVIVKNILPRFFLVHCIYIYIYISVTGVFHGTPLEARSTRGLVRVGLDQRSYSTPGPVSTGMGDRLKGVQNVYHYRPTTLILELWQWWRWWRLIIIDIRLSNAVVMAALYNREGHYIFVLWFLPSFFSSPNLSRPRLDVYHTIRHMVWP